VLRPSPRSALLLLLLLCGMSAGQQPPSGLTSSSTPPTLQVYSRLVLVDVTVTDAKGMPVRGLTRAQFHIYDDKRPQQISSFEEHAADPKARDESTSQAAGLYSNDFLIHPPRVNVILIDTNTIDLPEQTQLYDQLRRFIGELPPTEPVAIYHRWGDYTMLLQNFTANHEQLQAAVRRAIPRLPIPGAASYRDRDTLKQMLTYIGQVPGRKNVLWFSSGSNLFLRPDPAASTIAARRVPASVR
jgi:VWFA-related protein